MALNYIECVLNLASVITGCVSFSAFAFLVNFLVGIKCYAVGLSTSAKTAGIEKV